MNNKPKKKIRLLWKKGYNFWQISETSFWEKTERRRTKKERREKESMWRKTKKDQIDKGKQLKTQVLEVGFQSTTKESFLLKKESIRKNSRVTKKIKYSDLMPKVVAARVVDKMMNKLNALMMLKIYATSVDINIHNLLVKEYKMHSI